MPLNISFFVKEQTLGQTKITDFTVYLIVYTCTYIKYLYADQN